MRVFRTILLVCCLLIAARSVSQTALYADAGTGTMKNYISWFNWDGMNIVNGSTKTFYTGDGLEVNVVFTNVSGPAVVPYVMNTWSGAVLWKLYDFTNPAIKPALFSNNTLSSVSFQMIVTAKRDGVAAPFTFIAADAEASDNSEVMTLTTTGSAWRTIEFFRNTSQTNNPVGGCGTQTVTVTQTYGGSTATGQNPILATDASITGSMTISTGLNRTAQGNMAVAFGIFSPVDRGDLPASYSVAHHALSFTTSNSCNYNPPYPSITPNNSLYLGNLPGDPDGVQTADDNLTGADEESVAVFPLYNGSGVYSLTLSLHNNYPPVGSSATLSGWFDFNRDGAFSSNEIAVVTVPHAATSRTLTWTGLPATFPAGNVANFAFRFRISYNASSIATPGGYAPDGEVEDYVVALCGTKPDFGFYQSACTPRTIEFRSYTPNVASLDWNFGNGQTNTDDSQVWINYQNNGLYDVRLKVLTTGGCLDSVEKKITVDLSQNNSLITTSDTSICAGGSVPVRFATMGEESCFQYQGSDYYLNRDTVVTPASSSVYHFNSLVKGNNLLINGDFSQGNTGFTSAYTFVTNGTTQAQYGVTANPPGWNSSFANCKDHTTGAGNMMVIYGSPTHEKNVWKQTVTVTPNTDYMFSVWFQSLNVANAGGLFIRINDHIMEQNIVIGSTTCNWFNFRINWNSGNKTTADLSIGFGNSTGDRFALDDIFFGPFQMQTDSVVVTVLPNAMVNITNADTTICSGSSIQLNGVANTGSVSWTPTSYLSNALVNNPIASPSSTIKYFFKSNLVAGCNSTDSITITVLKTPTVQSIADTAICLGSSLQLQTAITDATNIQWQPTAGLSNGSIASPIATPSVYTEYSVIATNNGLCPVKDTVKVSVKPLPVVTVTEDTIICGTGSVQLLATGGVGYSWSPAVDLSSSSIPNPIAQPSATTKYKVSVAGVNGCSQVDSVTIQVSPAPIFAITPSTVAVCAGQPVTFTASGGDSYVWQPAAGITNPALPGITLTPTATASYSVTVSHLACKVSQTLTGSVQVNPLPVVTVTKSNDVDCSNLQSQLTATGGTTYEWTPSLYLSDPGIADPIASPVANTLYTVKVGSAAGCYAEETITVNFLGGSKSNLFIPNAFTPNNDRLNDEFRVSFKGYINFDLKIYNRWGELLFHTTDPSKGWNGKFRSVPQPNANYVYVISADGICGGKVFRKGNFMLFR